MSTEVEESPATPVEASSRGPAWRLWRPRRPDLLPLALVLVVVAAASAYLMRHETHFGPIDEFQHFNYVTEVVYHHRIPVPGDAFTQEAMRSYACHSVPRGSNPPRCDAASFDPADFQTGGRTTAGGYPPAYYVPTAIVAWVIAKATGAPDLFYPARIASMLWLLLGVALTYLLARSFAAGRWLAAGIAVLAAAGPMVLYQGSTVNPDSMSLLAGAATAAAWLALRGAPGRRAVVLLCAVLAFVALVKPNFLAVPIAVVLAEIALAARGGGRALVARTTWSPRRPTMRVLLAAAGAVVLGVAWPVYFRLVQGAASARVPGSVAFGAAPWDTDVALRGWAASLTSIVGLPKVALLNSGAALLLAAVVNVLVVSGAVTAALLSRRRELPEYVVSSGEAPPVDAVRALGYLGVASLVIAAPVTYAIVAASGAFIVYPTMYSLFIVPIGLVALLGLSMTPSRQATPDETSRTPA